MHYWLFFLHIVMDFWISQMADDKVSNVHSWLKLNRAGRSELVLRSVRFWSDFFFIVSDPYCQIQSLKLLNFLLTLICFVKSNGSFKIQNECFVNNRFTAKFQIGNWKVWAANFVCCSTVRNGSKLLCLSVETCWVQWQKET